MPILHALRPYLLILTRQGKAGKALTIEAISSFAGGTVGAVLLVFFAPALASVALLFHSSEYFALMVVGLSAIAAFAGSGQVTKALLMTIVGLALATVGEGAQFNMPRFTMGMMDLQSGIGFITLAMAMFAIPETLFLVLDPDRSGKAGSKQSEITDLRITKEEAKKITPVIGRQSLQGFLIGVMPGAGATIASFLGYAVERNIASEEERKEFGKGSANKHRITAVVPLGLGKYFKDYGDVREVDWYDEVTLTSPNGQRHSHR